MDNKNLSFSGEEFNQLTSKRNKILFAIFFTIIVFICIILYILVKEPNINSVLGIGIILLFIIPIALIVMYENAVTKTVYYIIANNSGWEIFEGNSKHNSVRDLYQFHLKNFGLLPNGGYVNFNNNLKGEIENRQFILQEISWEVPGRKKHGTTYDTVARYMLLTVDTPFSINCNILIKKNTILKWGIKKLKRVKIENQEFEKYYDVYSDDPGTAFTILNQDFINNLLYHKKVHKNLIELLITPEKVFLHQNIKEPLINLDLFISPMALCQKKIGNINSKLSILPILNLLKNQ